MKPSFRKPIAPAVILALVGSECVALENKKHVEVKADPDVPPIVLAEQMGTPTVKLIPAFGEGGFPPLLHKDWTD